MSEATIAARDNRPRKRQPVLGTEICYVDTGEGDGAGVREGLRGGLGDGEGVGDGVGAAVPLSATEKPKSSYAAPSAAVSLACWLQVVPLRTKTYAAPVLLFLP